MAKKQEQKRNLIITVAQNMFAKFGPEKTSIDEIAKAANLAKGTIYNYFKDKNHIYLAVIQKEADEILNNALTAISTIDSPIDKLKIFLTVKFQNMRQSPNIRNLNRKKITQNLPHENPVRENYLKTEFKIIKSILTLGVKNKIFAISNITLVTKAIIYSLKGFEINWLLSEDDMKFSKNLENHIKKMLNILLFGIIRRDK